MEAGKESVKPLVILFRTRAGCNHNYGHQRDEEVACVEYRHGCWDCIRSVSRVEHDAGNKAEGNFKLAIDNGRSPEDVFTYINVHMTQTVPNWARFNQSPAVAGECTKMSPPSTLVSMARSMVKSSVPTMRLKRT